MTDSPRDLLLAADRASQPRLDRIRAEVLERDLGPRWSMFGWQTLAAAWLLIALLNVLTPAGAPMDRDSAALAQAQQLLSREASTIAAGDIEPSNSTRIP